MPSFPSRLARIASLALMTLSLSVAGCGHNASTVGLARANASRPATQRADAVVSGPLTLLTMPDDSVAPIMQAIQAAQHAIKLKIYMLTDHDETAQLVQALVARAKEGIDVQVVLEVRPYLPPTAPTCVANGASPNQPAIAALQAGGVSVRFASPRFKFTHEKTMIVDDQTAYIMTCNFTNAAFTENREYVVIDHTPADVSELLRIFQADRDEVAFVPAAGPLVISPENSRRRLLDLIDSATKSLTIQMEYLTDPEVAQHLMTRVHAGVDIKVMLADIPPSVCPGDDTASQEVQMMAAAGVQQVEFVKTVKMHAKCLVVDGVRAFVGSENLTATSLDRNREIGMMLTDPLLVAKLADMAALDWASAAAGTTTAGGTP